MTSAEDAVPSVDRQIRALIEIIGTVAGALSRLSGRVDRLDTGKPETNTEPAPWVWAQPQGGADDAASTVVANFVAFYNMTFVGAIGGRAKPIPPCWRDHPALSAELATLTYAWRAANLGATANVRDAQAWLQQWRPGVADRMVRDWVHADCFDGIHRDTTR